MQSPDNFFFFFFLLSSIAVGGKGPFFFAGIIASISHFNSVLYNTLHQLITSFTLANIHQNKEHKYILRFRLALSCSCINIIL